MVVWIQNPFDSLPSEGARKMRYWLMAEAFARAGHRVTLWTSDFSHATKKRREFPATDFTDCHGLNDESAVEATGTTTGASETRGLTSLTTPTSLTSPTFEIRFIPTRPYRRNVSLARVASHRAYAREWLRLAAAEGAREKPDLIVASIPTISGASAAIALGRRFGAKVVVDVMDAWPETFERLVPRGIRGVPPLGRAAALVFWPLRRAARRVYRDADLVTGVSARYRDLTGRPDFYLAYHGIDLNFSATDFTDCHECRPPRVAVVPDVPHVASSPLRLVYAGNLGRTYDLATVVAAVEADPRLTLDVAGFGEFSSDCPRIRFHGLLSEPGLQALLASCDVGVVPMASDSWVGVPYKFCDYARAGLKIVSSLGGETSALLARYRCGATYRAGDAASFAAALETVASMPPGASRRMCEEVFDAKTIYDGYVRRVLFQA